MSGLVSKGRTSVTAMTMPEVRPLSHGTTTVGLTYGAPMRRTFAAVLLAATTSTATARAHAEAEHEGHGRALAVGAAIVPGAALHGAGHWVAGERTTARRLALVELAGLVLAGIGGAAIGVTGGAEEAMPLIAITIPGAGLLVTSWLADIYGAAGGSRIGGRAPTEPPRLEAELGYLYLHDPHFDAAHLATFAVDARQGPAVLGVSGWAGAGTWQARGEAGVRLVGAAPRRPGVDGTHLELLGRATERRFDDDGFATRTFEVGARGRFDAGRIGRTLLGAFVTGAVGGGIEQIRYRVEGVGDDLETVFDGRFGFGVYLGDGGRRHAEAELSYSHRRDELAGGLLLPVGSNGFVGSVGVDAVAYLDGFGLCAGVEIGSSWLVQLGMRFRLGGTR